MSDLALVYDIGGTSVRAGAYSFAERCLVRTARATLIPGMQPRGGAELEGGALFDQLTSLAPLVLNGEPPAGVVVAFPGPIDPDGQALAAPTVWGQAEDRALPIKALLQSRWPALPVLLLNDVTAAGFCYLSHPNESLCVVTVSSGIGHKVFSNGTPLIGPRGRGGEIGHLRVDFSPDAPVCDCGHHGHLGALASGRASRYQVLRLAAENPESFQRSLLGSRVGGKPEGVENEHLVAAYRDGDPWTEQVVHRMAGTLGLGLAAIHVTVGVERFVLIGGFALALGARYREQVAAAAAQSCWDLGLDWDRAVELGDVNDEAGLLGAGYYAASQMMQGEHLAPAPRREL